MKLDLYQIDAFTDQVFGGNPACVVPLLSWPANELLLKIAKENAVAETAFFVNTGDKIHLRWFTPEIEMDLCGHATLATAHVLKVLLQYPSESIVFDTLSGHFRLPFQKPCTGRASGNHSGVPQHTAHASVKIKSLCVGV